jgi:hypothetical protein
LIIVSSTDGGFVVKRTEYFEKKPSACVCHRLYFSFFFHENLSSFELFLTSNAGPLVSNDPAGSRPTL